MKPSLHKQKNLRGRIVGHVATIGPIREDGATPLQASEACDRSALAALDRLDRGPDILRWHGHVIVTFPTVCGWSYWIDTFSDAGYSVSCGLDSRETAIDRAIHHVAQHVWSHETDDTAFLATLPPSLRTEIKGWIAFQRAYVRFQAAGHSPNDCHHLACEASSASEAA